jgi:hypothetical protein
MLSTFLVSHPCWLNSYHAGAIMVERLSVLCISSTYQCHSNIVTYFRSVAIDGIWVGYWIYWHNSELQVITVLSLISTLYKSLHTRCSPACSVSNSHSVAVASNNGDSSAFCSQVAQLPVRNQLSWTIVSSLSASHAELTWNAGYSFGADPPEKTTPNRWLLSDSLEIIDMFTNCYQEMDIPSCYYCIATVLYATLYCYVSWQTLKKGQPHMCRMPESSVLLCCVYFHCNRHC